jgi:putative transposase
MARGNNRNKVFRSDADYQYYLKKLREYKEELPFDLFHYCLMPNHIHFLIRTQKATDFSLFMKKINLSYFHYFRNKYDWVGHFWQDRFKSQAVGKDSYFIQCGKYIELNPVRKGLCEKPDDYGFSSFRYYFCGESNDLLTEDFFFTEMGKSGEERQRCYQELIVDEELVKSYKKSVWGVGYSKYLESRKRKNNLDQ